MLFNRYLGYPDCLLSISISQERYHFVNGAAIRRMRLHNGGFDVKPLPEVKPLPGVKGGIYLSPSYIVFVQKVMT